MKPKRGSNRTASKTPNATLKNKKTTEKPKQSTGAEVRWSNVNLSTPVCIILALFNVPCAAMFSLERGSH